MQVKFGNKHLKELYTKGRSRKYKFQPYIAKKYALRIQQIEAADTIHDLWETASLNFEVYDDHYSVRINQQYRIEIEIEWENEEATIGIFTIIDVTNHYGD